MLSIKKYSREYIEDWRLKVDAYVFQYLNLAKIAKSQANEEELKAVHESFLFLLKLKPNIWNR